MILTILVQMSAGLCTFATGVRTYEAEADSARDHSPVRPICRPRRFVSLSVKSTCRAHPFSATLEGELRFTHSRLLESAEEIALYHGEEFEKNVIERGYFALVKHANRVLRIRVWHGMAEEGVIKWLWGSLGLCICGIPVFAGDLLGMKSGDLASRTEGQRDLTMGAKA